MARVSRCMTSDSANGSNCGVCSEGTLSDGADRRDLGLAEHPQVARQPAAEGFQRLARLQHRADRQQVLDHVGRTDAGQRALLVAAGHRRDELDDRVGRGELEFADRRFDARGRFRLPGAGQRRFEFARRLRRAVAGQPLPHRQQRRAPDLPRPDRQIAVDQKRLERTEQQARRIFGTRPAVILGSPRTTLRNCSSTKVATAVSSPRSIARSNSRISSACDCGGSCAR